MMRRLAATAIALALGVWGTAATAGPVVTHITTDGSTPTVVGQFSATGYAIDGGTRVGTNLFHSFQDFDLAAGDVAIWYRSAGDGGQITNVINRVTGGDISTIDGTMTTAGMPNAAFWFINPAGIVFGQGASVSVPNAAHFSTAQSLGFVDGTILSTTTPSGSTFTMAAPSAFGFLGGQGDIVVSGVVDQPGDTFAAGGEPMQFTAGNVEIIGSEFNAYGLTAAAVGSAQTSLGVQNPAASAVGNGTLLIEDSLIESFPLSAAGGGVSLAADQVVADGSDVFAFANDPLPGGDLTVTAGLFEVENGAEVGTQAANGAAGGNVAVNAVDVGVGAASEILTASSGSANGGAISVNAGEIDLFGGVRALAGGAGAGGAVVLNAPDIDISGGVAQTIASGAGAAGSIGVTADDQLIVDNDAEIISATSGTGAAGAIGIGAGAMTVTSGGLITSGGEIGSAGDGGDVTVDAVSLLVGPGASIGTNTLGSGGVGALRVSADDIDVSGGQIASVSSTNSDIGDVLVDGRSTLTVEAGGLIASSTTGPGNAGDLTLEGGDILITGNSIVTARTLPGSTGNAGVLTIDAHSLTVDASVLGSSTSGPGDAGAVTVNAAAVTVQDDGLISSDADAGGGNAGLITIDAPAVTVDGGADISSSSFDLGHAGEIDIQTTSLTVSDGGVLSSAFAGGDAGAIVIAASQMSVDAGGVVTSDTFGSGNAGSVGLNVGALSITGGARVSSSTEGAGQGGTVDVTAGSIGIDDGFLLSTASAGGSAGAVSVAANSITVTDGGAISSNAFAGASGAAGDTSVDAPTILLSDIGQISSATSGAGPAGEVSVTADQLTLQSGASISSNANIGATGAAGAVFVNAATIDAAGDSTISSETFGPGDAGSLALSANAIALTNGATISTFTEGAGNAGSIGIDVGTLSLASQGRILSSQANGTATGNAGAITINATSITVDAAPTDPLAISTSIFNAGSAGSVAITADTVALDGGGIGSSARGLISGASGDVTLTVGDLTMTNGGHIETVSLNPDKAGDIDVTARTIALDGASLITSANQSASGGPAGAIQLSATDISLLDGAQVTTNSTAGAAGDIVLTLPTDGELHLAGATDPGVITTSSGPGTGGRITISDPYLILSDGGQILALGQQGGANVQITAAFFVRSSDRVNLVSVDGSLVVDSQVGDLSSGAQVTDLSFLDASAVLRSQCAAAGAAGQTSRLSVRGAGPYAGSASQPKDGEGRKTSAASSVSASCQP